ncbi:hypothetical protein WK15_19340 [Burkholderia ubonensis]|nr:hypothetical protein WK15_19340 [Burkholderia ubonensis]KWC02162.1 hypothetical protein WL45_27480 [Burkholderia ubonensis]
MIDFDDLEDSRYLSCAMLVSESASSLAQAKASCISVVCGEVVDAPLNGPESRNFEPLGLDT